MYAVAAVARGRLLPRPHEPASEPAATARRGVRGARARPGDHLSEVAIEHAGAPGRRAARRRGLVASRSPPAASVPSDLVQAFVATARSSAEEIERVGSADDLARRSASTTAPTRVELRPVGRAAGDALARRTEPVRHGRVRATAGDDRRHPRRPHAALLRGADSAGAAAAGGAGRHATADTRPSTEPLTSRRRPV